MTDQHAALPARVAVVTGGSRGIGRALVARLIDEGFVVAALGRDGAALAAVSAATGALPLAVDVTDAAAVDAAMARVTTELGPPQLLVNNAGVAGDNGPSWTHEPADWWRVFEVNVLGTFLACRAVLPGMLTRGAGRIVNVSSGLAHHPVADLPPEKQYSAYMASKAAVTRFTEALAGEVAGRGVSVFAISPGKVRTDMTATIFTEDWEDDAAGWAPPDRAADLVAFLGTGALDRLSGRFIHAAADDWQALAGRVDEVLAADGLALRMRPAPDGPTR